MSNLLYRKELLRLAANAHGAGRLASPDSTGQAFNPACGDRVTVDLSIDEGRITGIAHETNACVLAQASASILGCSMHGANRAEVMELRAQIAAMLAGGGDPPTVPFEAYGSFLGAVEYDSRHRCVLLPIDAVLDALGDNIPSNEKSG